MSIKRRLSNLENRPFRKPVAAPSLPPSTEQIAASIRKKLCLPLPKEATDEEREHGLRMFRAAIERLKADESDTGGLDGVREFALRLHRKYVPDGSVIETT